MVTNITKNASECLVLPSLRTCSRRFWNRFNIACIHYVLLCTGCDLFHKATIEPVRNSSNIKCYYDEQLSETELEQIIIVIKNMTSDPILSVKVIRPGTVEIVTGNPTHHHIQD